MPHVTRRKLFVLACLYLSQGLPFGFFTQALPVFLRQQGHSLTMVGLTSALAAPWGLKFLWAPLVDRYPGGRLGRRRAWLLPLQGLTVLLLVLLAGLADRTQLGLLMGAVLLVNLLAATQDIATDALAVDILDDAERGLGNGVQVAGYRAGMVLGGGALLVVLDHTGLGVALLALGLMLALATWPVLRMREEALSRAAAPCGPAALPAALPAASRPQGPPSAASLAESRTHGPTSSPRSLRRVLALLPVLVSYKLGDALATAMLRPMLVDRGLSLSDIGWAMGVVAFGAGLLGALVGGALLARLGRARALVAFGALQALGVLGYALLASQPELGLGPVCALLGFEHFAGGLATVALFTLMMDAARPERAATDYTLMASVVVFATGLGALGAGVLAERLGYTQHFLVAALLSSVGVVVAVLATRPRRSRERGARRVAPVGRRQPLV